jgi:hypothetical protein
MADKEDGSTPMQSDYGFKNTGTEDLRRVLGGVIFFQLVDGHSAPSSSRSDTRDSFSCPPPSIYTSRAPRPPRPRRRWPRWTSWRTTSAAALSTSACTAAAPRRRAAAPRAARSRSVPSLRAPRAPHARAARAASSPPSTRAPPGGGQLAGRPHARLRHRRPHGAGQQTHQVEYFLLPDARAWPRPLQRGRACREDGAAARIAAGRKALRPRSQRRTLGAIRKILLARARRGATTRSVAGRRRSVWNEKEETSGPSLLLPPSLLPRSSFGLICTARRPFVARQEGMS